MKLDFDLNNVKAVEFGVGQDDGENRTFCRIEVDRDVQDALTEMTTATVDAINEIVDTPPKYDPGEKYSSRDPVFLPLNDELAVQLRDLHGATNLPSDATALSDPSKVFSYFCRMTDKKGRRLTALRRATQFKGVVKKRLIRLATDALKLVQDTVFKLDTDFDLLVDKTNVYVLRPSGFEFAGKLQEAVLAAVPKNVKAIQKHLKFVEFDAIEAYASKHPRAARYLASIRTEQVTSGIEKNALKKRCRETRVKVRESGGKLIVEDVMGFLQLLDRRRYDGGLAGDPELFTASSRRKLPS